MYYGIYHKQLTIYIGKYILNSMQQIRKNKPMINDEEFNEQIIQAGNTVGRLLSMYQDYRVIDMEFDESTESALKSALFALERLVNK